MEELFIVYTTGDVYIFDKETFEKHGKNFTLYKKAYSEEQADKYAEEACYI